MKTVSCPYCNRRLAPGLSEVGEGQAYQELNCPHVYRRAESQLDEVGLLKDFVETEWKNPPTNVSLYAKGEPPSPDWIEDNAERLLPIVRRYFRNDGGWWLIKNDLPDRAQAAQHLGLEIQRLRASGG